MQGTFYLSRYPKDSKVQSVLMPFLALPGSTVLIQRVVWLHLFEAGRANKEPLLRFVNPNTVESVVGLFTPLTGLGPNAFYWHKPVANTWSGSSGD